MRPTRSARKTLMSRSAPASGKSLSARLVVGADGRQSLCREAAGIAVRRRELNQAALTFNVSHSRPHRNISTEFHTPQGPCVFVPLPGDRCSVVWVAAPKEAERLIALSDDELSEAAEAQSHSILGRIRVEPGRHLFPLAIEQPRQFAKASHRAGRRGRACAAADRRAGPQHGAARRRRYRRHRARRDGVGRRSRRAAGAEALRIRRGAPTSPAGPSPSISPTARCSAISCRCNRCARPACI